MKAVSLILIGVLVTPRLLPGATGTIVGSDEELRRYLQVERPTLPETIKLAASSTATLAPKSAVIRAAIEVEGKTLAELLKLTADKREALRVVLGDITPEYAETFADPDSAIEIAKLKRLALRTDFRVAIPSLADSERVIAAIASVASVTITDVELRFDPASDLGSKLLDAAVADLARQKEFYEAAFNIELRLKSFTPFNLTERGGGDDLPADEEMVVLSPFAVDASGFWRWRAKNRIDDVVIHKLFQSRQVVKQISAVYEMHMK